MAQFSITDQMKVSTLQKGFLREFGLTLRIYDGRSFADPTETLARVRKTKDSGKALSVAKNMKVGNLEDKFEQEFGLKVQVAGSNDSYLCDNNLTLNGARQEDDNKVGRKKRKTARQNNVGLNEGDYATTSLISDEQAESLFADIEDHYNEKATWAVLVSSCGGNLQFVSFDIQKDPTIEEIQSSTFGWLFVAVLTAEESFDLSDDARTQILDDLESIADDLYDAFEATGFDPQGMTDYKIEMVDQDDVTTDVTKSNS